MLCQKNSLGLLILFVFIWSFHLSLYAQDFLSEYNPVLVERANTAKNAVYLSDEEKMVVLLANLARLDGKQFVEKVLFPYLQGEKQTKYTTSLKNELESIKNLGLLHPNRELYSVARDHAINSGKKGTTGHHQFNKRYGPLLGPYLEVAENCAYGYDEAPDILIRLLIDEGVSDLGHRKNLLNPDFNSIGISIQPHKNYIYNCVMSFGNKRK